MSNLGYMVETIENEWIKNWYDMIFLIKWALYFIEIILILYVLILNWLCIYWYEILLYRIYIRLLNYMSSLINKVVMD